MRRLDLDDLAPLGPALAAGEVVALPTDTVYGLACIAADRAACERLLRAKGRDLGKPSAIVVGSVEAALAGVLAGVEEVVARRVRALLPGPLTLVVPNPAGRYPWLCGATPERIGLRVIALDLWLARVLAEAGPLLLTSANAAREPPARTFAELAAVAGIATVGVDGGPCPGGVASTVVDVCGPEPVMVREGPVSLGAIRDRLGEGR